MHRDTIRISEEEILTVEEFEKKDGILVHYDLWLGSVRVDGFLSPVEKLPENMTVLRDISLIGSEIRQLPINMTVCGSLNLCDCKNIKTLPRGLVVGGELNLCGTAITDLPEDMLVGVVIYYPSRIEEKKIKWCKDPERIKGVKLRDGVEKHFKLAGVPLYIKRDGILECKCCP